MLQIRGIQYTPLIHDKLICTKLGHNIEIYLPSHIRACTLERLRLVSRLHQTANAKLYNVTKFPLYLLFTIHYFDT